MLVVCLDHACTHAGMLHDTIVMLVLTCCHEVTAVSSSVHEYLRRCRKSSAVFIKSNFSLRYFLHP